MSWTGLPVPYKPGKNDLLDTTRRVQAVFDAGWSLAIAGEGRIHRGERELLPLSDGAAYFALRAGVPIVPLAINGTSWLALRPDGSGSATASRSRSRAGRRARRSTR